MSNFKDFLLNAIESAQNERLEAVRDRQQIEAMQSPFAQYATHRQSDGAALVITGGGKGLVSKQLQGNAYTPPGGSGRSLGRGFDGGATKRRRSRRIDAAIAYFPFVGLVEGRVDLHSKKLFTGYSAIAAKGHFQNKKNPLYSLQFDGNIVTRYLNSTLEATHSFNETPRYGGYASAFDSRTVFDHTGTYTQYKTPNVVNIDNVYTPLGLGNYALTTDYNGNYLFLRPLEHTVRALFYEDVGASGGAERVSVFCGTSNAPGSLLTVSAPNIQNWKLKAQLAGAYSTISKIETDEFEYHRINQNTITTGSTQTFTNTDGKGNVHSLLTSSGSSTFFYKEKHTEWHLASTNGITSGTERRFYDRHEKVHRGYFNPINNVFTLETPITELPQYRRNQYNDVSQAVRTGYTWDMVPNAGSGMTIDQMITALEGTIGWTKTVYEKKVGGATEYNEVPKGAMTTILNVVPTYLTGVNLIDQFRAQRLIVTNPPPIVVNAYSLIREVIPIFSKGYIIYSANGVYYIYDVTIESINSNFEIPVIQHLVNNPNFVPSTYTVQRFNVSSTLVAGPLDWFPGSDPTTDLFIPRNPIAMNLTGRDTVLWTNVALDDGGGNES